MAQPNFRFAQLQPFTLAGAGAIIGATTVILSSMTDIDGVALSMATDFGTIGYGTLEPGTGTQEEQISFTGLTNNANGTTTLTGVKTVDFQYPYTETSGLAKTHAGGTQFVISNTSGYYNQFPIKQNDETITGQWTFSVFPITPSNSDASTTVKGVTKVSVAPASATDPIAVGTNDPRMPIAYAVDSVGSDAYAITPSPAITAYAAGQIFTFKAGTANTGACTLNVSGLGAKTIKKNVSDDLVTGDILANQIVVVEYDGTNMQMTSTLPAVPPVINVYTSDGTWAKPAGLKYIVVEVVGGGGGGGGADNDNAQAGGGGGGGYSKEVIAASALGATEDYDVGAAGTAGANTGTSGGDGGTSNFGTAPFLQATGGGGGGGSTGSGSEGVGGTAGSGSNGTLNLPGNVGVAGLYIDLATSIHLGGKGGDSFYGYGGKGGITDSGGTDGTGYGAGGGGAAEDDSTGTVGGLGTAGVVIVTEYFS